MKLHTCSEVISFAKQLEGESADFYNILSQKFAKDSDVFLSFIRENGKNAAQVDRAYYGVISDAIEGCFTFDLETDSYSFKIEMPGDISYSDALDKAIDMERQIIKFYSDAAEQSRSLVTDVARAFNMIAKKKSSRMAKLELPH